MKTVAVFERNEDVADLFEFILVEAGYRVIICRDPEALLEAAELADIAIVETFYLSKPAADYLISLCRRKTHLRVICVTGVPRTATNLLRANHSKFLLKPFTGEELLEAIAAPALVEACGTVQ
jgi:DNA-binding response OmpR family regulator